MRSRSLLAATLTALAAQPTTAATLRNQELHSLIPGNESPAASKLGGTYTDTFLPDGTLSRTNITTEAGPGYNPRDPLHPIYLKNTGRWSIEGNKLCRQIRVVEGGAKYCVDVVRNDRGFQMIYPRGNVEGLTFKNPPTK
jgi:hypothetical protein